MKYIMFDNKFKKIIFLSIATILSSCSVDSNIIDTNNTNSNTGKVVLEIPLSNFNKVGNFSSSSFKTKYLDPTDVFYGMVYINGSGFASQYTSSISPSNPVRLIDGNSESNAVSITMDSVPAGINRVIKVQPMDKNQNIIGSGNYDIFAPINIVANTTTYVKVNWDTTPSGKIINTLITNNSPYIGTIDNSLLQDLVNKIIKNNTQNTGDDVHPSLVNTTEIINYINANSGNLPNPSTSLEISTYRLTAGTVTGKVSGITYSIPNINSVNVKYIPDTKIICNDASSKPITLTDKDGYYTITGVTPGNGYTVTVIPQYHTKATMSGIASGTSNVNFSITKENYIDKAISPSLGVTHFSTSRPINIQLIKPNATKATSIGYSDAINREGLIQALDMWESLGNGFIDFNVLPDIYDDDANLQQKKNDADIYIEWQKIIQSTKLGLTTFFPDTSLNDIPPSSITPTYTYSTMPYNNEYRACINLSTYTCSCSDPKEAITDIKALKALALHEIGHALGLTINNVHSENLDDVMYSVGLVNKINWNIGTKDLNTLLFLYSLPPNITRN